MIVPEVPGWAAGISVTRTQVPGVGEWGVEASSPCSIPEGFRRQPCPDTMEMSHRGPAWPPAPQLPIFQTRVSGPAELGQGGAWGEEGLTQEVTFLGRGGDGEDRSQLPKEHGVGAHPQARPGSSRGTRTHSRTHRHPRTHARHRRGGRSMSDHRVPELGH